MTNRGDSTVQGSKKATDHSFVFLMIIFLSTFIVKLMKSRLRDTTSAWVFPKPEVNFVFIYFLNFKIESSLPQKHYICPMPLHLIPASNKHSLWQAYDTRRLMR